MKNNMENKICDIQEENKTPLSVCLFLTYEGSLKKWDEAGILHREVSLYKKLMKYGVKVAFFTFGDESDYKYKKLFPGIEIIPAYASVKKFKNRKLAFFQSLWLPIKFRKALKKYKIFKTNQMWGGWVALSAKFVCGGKLLTRCGFEHYYVLLAEKFPLSVRWWFYLISKAVYTFADHVNLTSEHSAKFVEDKFSIKRAKISVYSNFIDTDIFSPIDSAKTLSKRVFFIGRLNREKNIFPLITACKKAGFGLDLVGRGELKEEFENYSKEIGADVRFLGVYPNNQLPELIAPYPMFALPSTWEGNPKSLLEAMSCRKAVIGTNVDGIREIIKHHENGILCEQDADAIAEAILYLSDKPQLREALGENAREYVMENASLNDITRREFQTYKFILEQDKVGQTIISDLYQELKGILLKTLIKYILKFHNLFYGLAGLISQRLESDGLHPKHRLLGYHQWFVSQLKSDWSVLDVGCGNGALTADLAKHCQSVVGIDISQANIEEAKKRAQGEFILGDATEYPFDRKFDAIILSNTLEHIKGRVSFLGKLSQHSNKFLIRVPVIDRDWITLYKKELGVEYRLDKTHYTEYTVDAFQDELDSAGLEVDSLKVCYGEIYAVAKRRSQ